MKLNEIALNLNAHAVKKGFWDEEHTDEHCITMIVSEVIELMEAHRNGKRADMVVYKSDLLESFDVLVSEIDNHRAWCYSRYVKGTMEEEIADIVLRCLDLAGQRKWDFQFLLNEMTPANSLNFAQSDLPFTVKCYILISVLTNQQIPAEDKICYVLSDIYFWSKSLGINLVRQCHYKMIYNETRLRKHGKNY